MRIRFFYGFIVAALASVLLAACSETDNEPEEFPDWKATNERAFTTLYNNAVEQQKAGNSSWKVFNTFSKKADNASVPDDYIVVRVINEGKGQGSPLYTDSVSIHYRGRLLASTSYPDGYIFDSTWNGDYNLATMKPFESLPVRWEVYIPYQLAYGKTGYATGGIPGYSMLIFDLTLVGYSRVGTTVPEWK